MRQIFTGLVAAIAVGALGATPAMACGGGGLFSSSCSPCGQAYVSPCGQGGYGAGYGHFGYSRYQRLAVPDLRPVAPSPQYFRVNQGPVYDGPGQLAPRPYYEERTVLGWPGHRRGHYGYTGGPYANPINHYSYGAPALDGPAITSYHWRHHVRPAHVRHGHSHSLRYNARSNARHSHRHVERHVQRVANPQAVRTPRFRDSGTYSYRSGFRSAPNARQN